MNDLGDMLAAIAASELFRLLLLALVLGIAFGFFVAEGIRYFIH